MDELDAQIRTLVTHEADRVAPVTVAEARGRAGAGAPAVDANRSRPPARRFAMAAAAAVLVAGALAVVVTRDEPSDRVDLGGSTTTAADVIDPSTWEQIEIPRLGWTVQVPPEWTSQTWLDHCDRSSGALLTNRSAPIDRATEPPGCNTAWDPRAMTDQSLVGLLIADDPASVVLGEDSGADVLAAGEPLTLGSFLAHQRVDGQVEVRSTGGPSDVEGIQHLLVWIGDDATEEDLALLETVIASVTWERGPDVNTTMAFPAIGGPLSTTLLTCLADRGYAPTMEVGEGGEIDGGPGGALTWSDADRANPNATDDLRACVTAMEEQVLDRQNAQRLWPAGLPGPSQSPADAARDQIIGDLAALPLDERAQTWPNEADPFPLLWFVTPTEIWVTVEPPRRADGVDCVIGDPDGAYGTEQVCTHEYAELLRLDHDGNVLAAYPFPSLTPSWIHTTADAVYLGRLGDGGEPSSMVARIDRTTGDAEVVVFPIDETGERPDGLLNVAYDGWRIAPPDLELATIVQTGYEGPGTLVQSYTGPVRVQPEGLAQLFGP